jgi:hypothetical protein
MADEQKPESEREDLLDKIDLLKKQIKTFENELGINVDELKRPRSAEESHVLHKMLESEEQLGVMEKLIKKEAVPPPIKPLEIRQPEAKPVAAKPSEEKLLEGPHMKLIPTEEKPQVPEALSSDLKEKSKQIAEISAMVSQLRENMQALKQKQPEEKPYEKAEIAPAKPVVTRGTDISKEDLPLISNLIEKLDSLIRSNQEISERLRELISDNKNVSAANRISYLIKKLAQAGLNG